MTVKFYFAVPQRSNLGPILFLIFINDLPNASPLMYYIPLVNDTNIFYYHSSLNSLCQVVNTELTQIAEWICANKLSLNSDSDSGQVENLLPQLFTLYV